MMVLFCLCSQIKITLQFKYINQKYKQYRFIPVVAWGNVYLQYICNTSLLLYCTEHILICTELDGTLMLLLLLPLQLQRNLLQSKDKSESATSCVLSFSFKSTLLCVTCILTV